MGVSSINHVNIRTLDIPATARFYSDILGLRYDGPQEVDGFARNWLYDPSGTPIIHLRAMAPQGDTTGALDHIALSCDDIDGIVARLDAQGIGFARRDNVSDGIIQMFVKDPNGIQLELNFPLGGD